VITFKDHSSSFYEKTEGKSTAGVFTYKSTRHILWSPCCLWYFSSSPRYANIEVVLGNSSFSGQSVTKIMSALYTCTPYKLFYVVYKLRFCLDLTYLIFNLLCYSI